MNRLLTFLTAAALGASAMYYLDPEHGRRRRAQVSSRVDGVSHGARDYLDKQRKRGVDRLQGVVARMRGRLEERPMSDQQLHGRLRSRLGRAVSYPHGIETEVQQGRVQLRGHVLADEFNVLMTEIWALPGVTAVDSQLSLHSEPGGVPALSGEPNRITRARLRTVGRGSLPAVALIGGLGAGLRGLSREGASKVGLLSLAAALLAYGMGNGATRIARQRWGQGRLSGDQHLKTSESTSAMEAADAAAGLGVMEQPLPSSPSEPLPTTPGGTPSPWH
jgi:hypothetical protein